MHDIVVVGAGPAGCALAAHLSGSGLDVLLIDAHPADPALRPMLPGERLWPDSRLRLEQLGVACEEVSIPSPATRILWDTPQPRLVFEENPVRWAVAVDRRALDAALARSAVRCGARVRHGVSVSDVRGAPGAWTLSLADGGDVRAHFIVDATGRGSHIAARLGIRRVRTDALVAVLRWWEDGEDRSPFEIEAVRNGWFYRLPLPGGRGVMGAMTFRRLAPGAPAQAWQQIAANLSMISPRPPRGARLSDPAFFAAAPSRLAQPLRAGFAAVGDACLAGDPIEGRGIDRGLRLAEALAMLMLSPAELGSERTRDYLDLLGHLSAEHAAGRCAQYAQSIPLGGEFRALLGAARRGRIQAAGDAVCAQPTVGSAVL